MYTPDYQPAEQSRPTGYAWSVVALLSIVALLNYLDRLMITTMREPIRAAIPMSDAQFGLLTSVFLWVYAVVSPIGGYLADRAGRRGAIIASLFCWSAATFATAFARSSHQLLAARAMMGISEACYMPAALALIADFHPGSTRSLATGFHMTGLYAGAALGGVGGIIAERHGWAAGFKILGAVGIAYSVMLTLALRDAPRDPIAGVVDDDRDAAKIGAGQAAEKLLSSPGLWILLLVNVLVGIVNWAVYGWMPTFFREQFHLSISAAGLSATGYIQIASFGGVLFAGLLADHLSLTWRGARALVPAIGFALAGPCLFGSALTGTFAVAVACLVIFGIGRGAFDANHMPLLREIVDERYSASGYGLLNFVSTSAGGIMVYAGGALRDAHVPLGTIFQVAGIALFVAGALLLVIRLLPSPAARGSAR